MCIEGNAIYSSYLFTVNIKFNITVPIVIVTVSMMSIVVINFNPKANSYTGFCRYSKGMRGLPVVILSALTRPCARIP